MNSSRIFRRGALTTATMLALLLCGPAATVAQNADKTALVNAVREYKINSAWESMILDKYFTFKVSPACWKKLCEKDGWGPKTAANSVTNFAEYAKRAGWGDFEAAESANNNDRENNKPHVQEMVNDLSGKFSFTLNADQIACSDAEWELVHRMWGSTFEALANGRWKPKHGAVHLTMTFSPKAKDIAVTVAPDGQHFSVTCPSQVEPEEWDTKIQNGLNRAK